MMTWITDVYTCVNRSQWLTMVLMPSRSGPRCEARWNFGVLTIVFFINALWYYISIRHIYNIFVLFKLFKCTYKLTPKRCLQLHGEGVDTCLHLPHVNFHNTLNCKYLHITCYYCLQSFKSTAVLVGPQYIGVRLSHIIFLNHKYGREVWLKWQCLLIWYSSENLIHLYKYCLLKF